MTEPLFPQDSLVEAVAALRHDLIAEDGPQISTMRNYRFAILPYRPRDEFKLRQLMRRLTDELRAEGWGVLPISLQKLLLDRIRATGDANVEAPWGRPLAFTSAPRSDRLRRSTGAGWAKPRERLSAGLLVDERRGEFAGRTSTCAVKDGIRDGQSDSSPTHRFGILCGVEQLKNAWKHASELQGDGEEGPLGGRGE